VVIEVDEMETGGRRVHVREDPNTRYELEDHQQEYIESNT
jgi:hypothetical protein